MKKIVIVLVIFLVAISVKAQDNYNLESYLIKAGYTQLKLKKMPTGHLHINGVLNGINGNFIIDTGATGTVIEIKNEEKFKMKTKTSDRQAAGAGGANMQMKASSENILIINGYKLKDINLMLMNLDHVNHAFERFGITKVDGIIGADILTSQNAIIDYVNLSVYLKE